MKKRIGLLLMALVLATTALASRPAAGILLCRPPACFIGPGCCTDAQCSAFCNNLSPGSVPHCSDPNGGCCSCEIVE